MKKLFAATLLIALVSMAAFAQDGNKRKGRQTANPSATPRVKKPVNNSTDSVADYNRPNRQSNQQDKSAQRQAQQQERAKQREAKAAERAAQREQKQQERAAQRQNGNNSRRGQNNGQNENLQDVIVSSKKPKGRANNNAQSENSANAPTQPCSQLSGTDWLYKGKKCLDANGNVTTVGAYQRSQGNGNATGNRRAGGKNQNGNGQLWDTAGQEDATPKGQGRRGGRLNRNNPPANPEEPTATGDGQRRPPSAQNGRRPNIPGARVESTDTNSNNNSTPPNIPGATVTPNSNGNNPNLPNIPGATVTPNNKPGTTPPSSAGNQAQTTPPNNTRPPSGTDANVYGFDYPERPEEIVTWNQNLGPYGYTTVKEGWEFILTSNIGVAIRKFGRERTVVAHTKCNDPANYEFGYGGSGGRIDMIMCRPKREGLPRLRPSIMIVPPDRYWDDQR